MIKGKRLTGCGRLFVMEVNTIYLHVPDGDNLLVHFADRTPVHESSQMLQRSLHCYMLHTHTHAHVHKCMYSTTDAHTLECNSGEGNLVILGNFKPYTGCNLGKNSPKCMKKT